MSATKQYQATRIDVRTLDDFTRAYLECALWSSTDDDGDPLDTEYSLGDIAPDALAQMVSDCADFQESNGLLMKGLDASKCGHDFWLTRNGHGAGFWDRGLGAVGDELTKNAHAYGSADLYVGDDGLIYHA